LEQCGTVALPVMTIHETVIDCSDTSAHERETRPGPGHQSVGAAAERPRRHDCGYYQEQQLVQQQLPPPQVVDAPGATVTVRPPVAVAPM